MTSRYYATSTMKTRDGIIQGTVRSNPSRPREYQVNIDGELVGEFATPEEAVDELKRSGFKNVKITESKITFKQQKLIENYIRKEVRKRLNEETLRSVDLWKILIDVIENNQNRSTTLANRYSGEEIYNALENLLNIMKIPIKKI